MLEITFQTEKEASYLHQLLNTEKENFDFQAALLNGTVLTCETDDWETFISDVLVPSFVDFFLNVKEPRLLLFIIEKQFYFEDEDEKQQILHIAQSILEGERAEIPMIKHFEPRENLIISALTNFLRPNQSFSIESFIQFRLSDYLSRLSEYVGLSIEEYKMEQEYQNFIQSLREYVLNKKPKLSTIHILHDISFQVFNEKFIEIKELELKKWIDREFIYRHPMYIDSHLLAPLVSIAPLEIYIYSDQQEEAMIQTIQNIFQERVRFFSRASFQKR